MINGETGYLSMDVKVPVDKGVRNDPSAQVTQGRGWEVDAEKPQRMWFLMFSIPEREDFIVSPYVLKTYKRASLGVLVVPTNILLLERYWKWPSALCFVQAKPKSMLFIVCRAVK